MTTTSIKYSAIIFIACFCMSGVGALNEGGITDLVEFSNKQSVDKETHAILETLLSQDSLLFQREILQVYKSNKYDKIVYDVIAELLLENHKRIMDTRRSDGYAWLSKVLAWSNDPRYLSVLRRLAEDAAEGVLRGHASKSLKKLQRKTRDSKLTNDEINAMAYQEGTIDLNKYRNKYRFELDTNDILKGLLIQDSLQFQIAIKQFYYTDGLDNVVYDVMAELLLKNYGKMTESQRLDGYAWICGILALTNDFRYMPVLEIVAKGAHYKKLTRYARKAINNMKRIQDDTKATHDRATAVPYQEGTIDLVEYRNKYRFEEGTSDVIRRLFSPDSLQFQIAIKQFYYTEFYYTDGLDNIVYDVMAELLLKNHKDLLDRRTLDAYRWICKIFANIEGLRYMPVLEQVSQSAHQKKLSGSARKSFKKLKRKRTKSKLTNAEINAIVYKEGTIDLAEYKKKYSSR